jgi:hypothetical protein
MGPTARLVDEKQPDEPTRQQMRRDIEAAFAKLATAAEMRLPSTVLLVTAHRP